MQSKNNYFYEIIKTDLCKLYFDIDNENVSKINIYDLI